MSAIFSPISFQSGLAGHSSFRSHFDPQLSPSSSSPTQKTSSMGPSAQVTMS
jgi:hypothetical protein